MRTKLEAGQAALIWATTSIKTKQLATQTASTQISTKITKMEQDLIDAKQTRREVEILETATRDSAALIREIHRTEDDLENRS